MTSVKIDAKVEDWSDGSDPTNVNLPDNQPADDQQGGGVTPGGDTPGGDTPGGDTPGGDTPTPAPPATIAEAVAANVTSFTYTLVNSSDPAGAEGTLSLTETKEYTNTTTPSLTGTYYKFTRANDYVVWIKSDAPIDGTTENRVLGNSGSLSDSWRLILQPKE